MISLCKIHLEREHLFAQLSSFHVSLVSRRFPSPETTFLSLAFSFYNIPFLDSWHTATFPSGETGRNSFLRGSPSLSDLKACEDFFFFFDLQWQKCGNLILNFLLEVGSSAVCLLIDLPQSNLTTKHMTLPKKQKDTLTRTKFTQGRNDIDTFETLFKC